jgi:hypothetical protein
MLMFNCDCRERGGSEPEPVPEAGAAECWLPLPGDDDSSECAMVDRFSVFLEVPACTIIYPRVIRDLRPTDSYLT